MKYIIAIINASFYLWMEELRPLVYKYILFEQYDLAKLAIDHGADANRKNYVRSTAADFANDDKIEKLLREAIKEKSK